MKYVLHLLLAITLIACSYLFSEELGSHFLAEGLIIFASMVIIDLADFIIENRKRLLLRYQCWVLSLKGEKIRFSMAYQYRIKIDDKYLLVRNSHWPFYQHVGGKYKRTQVTQKILADFDAEDDIKMPTSGLKKDDLAVFIPAQNAIKFLDWFNTGKDREISHWREFYEELIDVKGSVLSTRSFPYVNYHLCGRFRTPLKPAKGWDCQEILQYDVLDLLPTPEQEKKLKELLAKGDTDYLKWADYELIQTLGYDTRSRTQLYTIGEHTKWVLNMKWCRD